MPSQGWSITCGNGRPIGDGEPGCFQVENFRAGFKTNVQEDVTFTDYIKFRHHASMENKILHNPRFAILRNKIKAQSERLSIRRQPTQCPLEPAARAVCVP